MTDRPDRKPLVPLVNPAAALPEELAENFRRIYAGALADQRSLEAGGGVYAVRCLAPLVVTDDGVAFNWHDPIVFEVLRGMMGDGGLVKVDEGDTADFLKNQLITYDDSLPASTYGVEIVQPGGPHTPLMGRVKITLGGQDYLPGGQTAASLELKIHYFGTNSLSECVSTLDWRRLLLRCWSRGGPTLPQMQQLFDGSAFFGDSAADLWPSHGWQISTSLYVVPAVYVSTTSTATVSAACRVDGPTGHLYLDISNESPQPFRGDWSVSPSPAYTMGDVVLASNGSSYQFAGPNNTDPTLNLGDWAAYTMPEAWFHIRVDVMGEAPQSAGEFTGKGSAS